MHLVPLLSQKYKWVPANMPAGLNPSINYHHFCLGYQYAYLWSVTETITTSVTSAEPLQAHITSWTVTDGDVTHFLTV